MRNFRLSDVQLDDVSGMDSFLGDSVHATSKKACAAVVQQQARQLSHRVRVGSLQQLEPFSRVSADTLIHKSTKDLWSLQNNGDGTFYIEQMFDASGGPLKE